MAIRDLFTHMVTLDDAFSAAHSLAAAIKKDAHAHFVVCIHRGGVLPGLVVSEAMGVPLLHMSITRGLHFGHVYQRTPQILRTLLDVYYGYKHYFSHPLIVEGLDLGSVNNSAIVIDDILRTGRTMSVAIDHVIHAGARTCMSASLCCIGPTCTDYYWSRRRFTFPWSRTSRYHVLYIQYLLKRFPMLGLKPNRQVSTDVHKRLLEVPPLASNSEKERLAEELLELAHNQVLGGDPEGAQTTLEAAKRLIHTIRSQRWV
jgi:hypoxanthine phosphoribosyltransferase